MGTPDKKILKIFHTIAVGGSDLNIMCRYYICLYLAGEAGGGAGQGPGGAGQGIRGGVVVDTDHPG